MWLLPLRLLLIGIMVTIGTTLGAIAGIGESPKKPLQGWKKLINIINFFLSCLFGWDQLV